MEELRDPQDEAIRRNGDTVFTALSVRPPTTAEDVARERVDDFRKLLELEIARHMATIMRAPRGSISHVDFIIHLR